MDKIIHYCWFGKREKPAKVREYIESWREVFEGYELREWNEDNFDINSNAFVKHAYDEGRLAFVADYCRLYALYKFGGIYLDTDVKAVKDFGRIADTDFVGYEGEGYLCTAVMGFEKNSGIIRQFMENFVVGRYDYSTPMSKHFFDFLKDLFDIPVISDDVLTAGNITVYPAEYFSPKNVVTGKICVTEKTVCVHDWHGGWKKINLRIRDRIKKLFKKKS